MSVTPGYNFGTNEEVTAAKLMTFIKDATISDVSWSEVDSTIPRFAITTDTAFSLGPEGSVWFDQTTRELMVQSRWGPLALWSPVGMETRRLAANISGSGPIAPWLFVGIDSSGDPTSISLPGFEIKAGVNSGNLASKVIGVLQHDTAVTGNHARIRVAGMTKVQFSDFQEVDNIGEYGGSGGPAGRMFQEAAETTDKVCAVIMGTANNDVAGESVTGWIYLFPNIWRA